MHLRGKFSNARQKSSLLHVILAGVFSPAAGLDAHATGFLRISPAAPPRIAAHFTFGPSARSIRHTMPSADLSRFSPSPRHGGCTRQTVDHPRFTYPPSRLCPPHPCQCLPCKYRMAINRYNAGVRPFFPVSTSACLHAAFKLIGPLAGRFDSERPWSGH